MKMHHGLIYFAFALGSLIAIAPAMAATTRTVHLIAGPPSHGWDQHEHIKGCKLLAEALNTCGLNIKATLHTNSIPDTATLKGADALVLYSDGGNKKHIAKGRAADLRTLWKSGCGLVILHYALEPSDDAMTTLWMDALGGYFDAKSSINPLWTVQSPTLGKHPVTRGVNPFEFKDEWYYHIRFQDTMQGVTPVLSAIPPPESVTDNDAPYQGNPAVRKAVADKIPQHLCWAREDDQGRRGFGFTGGHFHRLWAQNDIRTLVLNGIAWTAGVEIPKKGVTSSQPIIPVQKSLVHAVSLDDTADIKLHILAGADINEQAKTGWTALHHAAVRNRVAAAKTLLALGADTELTTKSGKTPLHYCGERGFTEIATALIEKDAKLTAKDQEGWTPLHYAAERDKLDVARFMISKGADVNAASVRGGTPLHEAAASSSGEMMKLLLDNGGDPAIKATNGKTPLEYAIELENAAAEKILKEHKR